MAAFDPLEFSALARSLASRSPSEAAYRTSVGRLYYSLHLLARGRLRLTRRQLGSKPHIAVVGQVRRRDLAVGNQLDRLRKLRVEADYFLQPSSPQFANWGANYQTADLIATRILPRIQRLK